MTVRRALQMVATLRGVPRDYLYREVMDYIDALGEFKLFGLFL